MVDKLLVELVESVHQSASMSANASVGGASSSGGGSRKKKSKAAATPTSAAGAWSDNGDAFTDWKARDRSARSPAPVVCSF